MTKDFVDLRSDAVTQPTDEMWDAMRRARLGWAPAGDDPSVSRLEQVAAELTGKEAALFVPTGSMANLIALMSHTEPGDQIIAEAYSHILWSEEWGYASVCGLALKAIPGGPGRSGGAISPDEARDAFRDIRFGHQPRTALLCLENTHNMSGGTVLSLEATEALAAVAHEHGVPVHLDGARIFNAAIALGLPINALVEPVDSVVIGLTKGLSAPAGSLLCGSATFNAAARIALRRVGGHSIPQAGILAAAGLVALQTMGPRLAEDHRRARMLAEELAGLPGISVDLAAVQTNIVMATIGPAVTRPGTTGRLSAETMARCLAQKGIGSHVYTEDTLRFVTHRHIEDDDIHRVVAAMEEIAQSREETCSTS
jgi:threonine aldolase